MISKFFIERPVLANVIAILMVVIGVVALFALPVAQYPDVVPPTVQVTTRYPGASARTVIDTVALPIEQQVNGVEGMIYMQSYTAADGSYTLTVTFKIGTDLNFAQVLVQNRVSSALSSLPQAVQAQGVNVQKKSTAILQIVTLTSPDERYDSLYLANYATIRLKDEIARLPGVGNVVVFGAGQYSMRVWLDPDKMQARGLDAAGRDPGAAAAERAGHRRPDRRAAGARAASRSSTRSTSRGRLDDPEQFANVIVKTGQRRRDHAGARRRPRRARRADLRPGLHARRQAGGRPGDLPGARRQCARRGRRGEREDGGAGARNSRRGSSTPFPSTPRNSCSSSIHEVYKTLYEAAILVLIVILVFLQDWRAMLVPATTVPVTIIGAFAAMAALGFTVNLSTLFAIVLAIGIVVDDAIVVVEGAAHNIEKGMSGHEAAIAAMDELFGPIIGITLVLMAVFLPAAFLPGLTGRMYAQFALVIAATALISAINAATLKPTQARMWLRPAGAAGAAQHLLSRLQPRLRRDRARLCAADRAHGRPQRRDGARWRSSLIGVAGYGFSRVPTGFLPIEDQGYMIARCSCPTAPRSSARRRCSTRSPMSAARRRASPGRHHRRRLAARQQRDAASAGVAYIILKDGASAAKARTCSRCSRASTRRSARSRRRDILVHAAAADPGRRQRCRLHHAGRAARRQLRPRQAAKHDQCDRGQCEDPDRPSSGCWRRSARTSRNIRSRSTG